MQKPYAVAYRETESFSRQNSLIWLEMKWCMFYWAISSALLYLCIFVENGVGQLDKPKLNQRSGQERAVKDAIAPFGMLVSQEVE